MRQLVGLCMPLALLACAPQSTIPEARTDRSRLTMEMPDGLSELQLTQDAAIASVAIAADPEAVWAVLPDAFARLEVNTTGINTGARLLWSTDRIGKLGGKSMGNYFECPGAYTNLAFSGDLYMTLRTQVLPAEAGPGSVLRTEVGATARSSTGRTQARCRSKGSLEELIAETVQGMLPAR